MKEDKDARRFTQDNSGVDLSGTLRVQCPVPFLPNTLRTLTIPNYFRVRTPGPTGSTPMQDKDLR